MLTRTSKGVLREVFVETVLADFGGGTSYDVQTTIPRTGASYFDRPAIDYVEVYMYIDAVNGNPVIPDPVPSWDAGGRLVVHIENNGALPTDQAAFTLDIRLNSTLVR